MTRISPAITPSSSPSVRTAELREPVVRTVPIRLTREEKAPDPEDARDIGLLAAHRAGDPSALGELLERFQGRLFAVCMRMTNDRDRASDMLQETMVRVIKGVHAFDGRSKLSTWMIRVTINVCLTDRRRQRIRKTVSLETPIGGCDGGDGGRMSLGDSIESDREHGVGEGVERCESRRVLYEAMGSLDGHHRAILILRDVQGLDYRQIGAILDIPEGTVKSRLFRARAALRDEIERLGGPA